MSKSMTTMTLAEWTDQYDRECRQLGWSLFDADGTIRIQRIDEPELGELELANDFDALELVFSMAAKGHPGALIALFMEGEDVYEDIPSRTYAKFDVPRSMVKKPKRVKV